MMYSYSGPVIADVNAEFRGTKFDWVVAGYGRWTDYVDWKGIKESEVDDGSAIDYEKVKLMQQVRILEEERDKWERWCNRAESEAAYLRDRLNNIREISEIREVVETEGRGK